MKKFFDKVYKFSHFCSKIRSSNLSIYLKKKYKQRSLSFTICFTKRNFFVSFFNKRLNKNMFNSSVGAKSIKSGSQASKKISYLIFQRISRKFPSMFSKDAVIFLKGQSWIKKRVLGSFISYWGLNLKRFSKLEKFQSKSLNLPLQLLLIKSTNKKAFNGCRVRKQKN